MIFSKGCILGTLKEKLRKLIKNDLILTSRENGHDTTWGFMMANVNCNFLTDAITIRTLYHVLNVK